MKYSKKFKQTLNLVRYGIRDTTLSNNLIFKEDYVLRNRVENCILSSNFDFDIKYFSHCSFTNCYVFRSLNEINIVLVYLNKLTNNYCVLLHYFNYHSFSTFNKSFFVDNIKELSNIFDNSDYSSISDIFTYFKNIGYIR